MMASPLFDKEIRERLKRIPFQPFVIEYDDGEKFVVDRPEVLMDPGGGRTVYFRPDGSFSFVDCEAVKQMVEFKSS